MAKFITPEQGHELKQLYEQLPVAATEAVTAIAAEGMASQRFRDADSRVGDIFARIREIVGE